MNKSCFNCNYFDESDYIFVRCKKLKDEDFEKFIAQTEEYVDEDIFKDIDCNNWKNGLKELE